MDHSCQLKEIELFGLIHEQFWDSCYNIENEVAREVVDSNSLEFFVCSCFLDEIEKDINEHDYINGHFDFVQILLGRLQELAVLVSV